MDSAPFRSYLIRALFVGLAALLAVQSASAEITWTTLTSLKDVRRMRTFNDSVFIVTGGGLLVVTDPTKPGKTYDNLSSIGAVDLTDLIQAADGQKWIAAQGRLIRLNGDQSVIYPFFDTDNKPIRLLCLADDGDKIWVGTTAGLVLFSKTNDGGQIQDSYTIFGTLDASPSVNDILLVGDSIWLATSAGIAVAVRTAPNLLKVPANWTSLGAGNHPELGTSQPRRIVLFESNYYVGTSDGLFRFDRNPVDTLNKLTFGIPPWVTEMKIENDSMFIYIPDGLGVLKSGTLTLLGTFGLPIFPVNGTNTGSYRWLALLNETGLYNNAGGTFHLYSYTGLPSTGVNDVIIGLDGLVTGLFSGKQVYQQNDTSWTSRPIGSTTVGALDSSGNPWVGTFGNGLWRITPTTEENFDETNSSLRGNTDNPPVGQSYVVIKGLAIDNRYVYAAAYRALNNYPIAIGDLNNINAPTGWDSLGVADGITDIFVSSLDHDSTIVAVGTESNGLFTIDLGPDPRNKSDDTSFHFTTTNGFLVSDNIRCVRFSPTGDLWVGTNFGVSKLEVGFPYFRTVNLPSGFGPDVTAIEFDPRGNVWFGSDNGVARFDVATGTFDMLNSFTSGLINDDVRSIKYDALTGDMYISTAGGLSIARSQFGTPTSDVKSTLAFPNPYVFRSLSDHLHFNFSKPGMVRILTIAGERVAEVDVNSGWNGTNDAGKSVASGVYFFIITSTTDGTIGTGKFLLVRQQ